MTVLRPYQHEVVGRFWETVGTGRRRVICVAPTGSGKTVIAGDIVHRVVADGGRALRPTTLRACRLHLFRHCTSVPSGARKSPRRPLI
jgi:ERCC4-related helicase